MKPTLDEALGVTVDKWSAKMKLREFNDQIVKLTLKCAALEQQVWELDLALAHQKNTSRILIGTVIGLAINVIVLLIHSALTK